MAHRIDEKQLKYIEYVQRENLDRHHTDAEDRYQYDLLKNGDPKAVTAAKEIFSSDLPGHVSDDPVRNYKYLFVASITLASRSAIAGGMDAERAYNISDLYIQKMDHLTTVEEVTDLHEDMFSYYVKEMQQVKKKQAISKPISTCIDYIYLHLHEKIKVSDLAALVNLNRSYFSVLFKKEMGCSVAEYISAKKIETAQNMLKYSEYSYAEIGLILAFCSQSHFTRVFKEKTGITPREYRVKG